MSLEDLRRRPRPQAGQAKTRQVRPWRLSAPALLWAACFFAMSLTPSLVPRDPVLQAVLGGVVAAAGYALGAVAAWLWRLLLLPELDRGAVRAVLFALALAVLAAALVMAPGWQNATRAVMGLDPVDQTHDLIVGGLGLAVFLVLWVLGSLFTLAARRLGAWFSRVLPGRLGPVLGLLIATVLVYNIGNGVVVSRAMEIADAGFAAGEQVIDPAFARPEDPMRTGGPGSLIDWDDLGNRGRDFIGRTPEASEISAFTGQPAMTPVRVYVGRVSAPTARARAELALQELIRVGGFEREILIVATPVGTGWMDPGSHDTIDFMWGGNTAHVAAQYSYLTSVLSILTQVEYGFDQSRELFNVIHDYWAQLPPDRRPRLYIHGLSQGALNSQATLPLFDVLDDPPQGAFWAGSPFLSPIWSYVRDHRVAGSPAFRPSFGNGSMVRTFTQEDPPGRFDRPWGPIRFVFLNYGSDPIVVFDPASFWRPPAWLSGERAFDVAPEMRWFPVVTAFQLGLDMTVSLGVAGFGHYYIARDYIDAWAELTDPPDWSPERAETLKALFEARPAPW